VPGLRAVPRGIEQLVVTFGLNSHSIYAESPLGLAVAESVNVGPTCEIRLKSVPDGDTLAAIDTFLSGITGIIERSRKGRQWDVWIGGRPVHVAAPDTRAGVELSAGCNSPEDYEMLRRLGLGLAEILGGQASEPVK
jgi:hypothetical protein